MNDEAIIERLRSEGGSRTPVELAEFLDRLTDGKLSQGTMITYFQRAFPGTPLRVLLEAGGWERVSDGGMTDAEFNALLSPWLA